ncbi:MAG: hypothetical protein PHD05_01925 [Sphaerochaetaceae bacterium]|nr:hypothetical protein [Sphaerochaetaceae bacterium]
MNKNYSELTAKIINYQNSKPNSKKHKTLEGEILNRIRLIVYFAYKKNPNIKEEDAASFLFYFEPKISRIIENFTFEQISFECYLISIIQKRIIGFYSIRSKRIHKNLDYNLYIRHFPEQFITIPQTSLINTRNKNITIKKPKAMKTVKTKPDTYSLPIFSQKSFAYENLNEYSNTLETNNLLNSFNLESKKNNLELNKKDKILIMYKINLILSRSKIWRRRIISYFLSISIALKRETLDNCLYCCNINKKEFYYILKKLQNNLKNIYNSQDKQKDLLYSNFSRYLRIEKENEEKSKSLNYIPTKEDLEKLRISKDRLNRKLSKLQEIRQTIPQNPIAKLIGIPRSTLSTDIFFVKVLFKACIDPNVEDKPKLGEKINLILNYPLEYFKSTAFIISSPFEALDYDSKETRRNDYN